ncbi:MAG: NAD-dependent epimerase/dehydratase family protein [Oscillospiraceae bacterium]|jgi:dihydroflavonol-4-reductase|nr:NAD-dependent epimerase/dehydratase family protein [Oscillospiraceae bacterium]
MSSTSIITGATGHIGYALVRELLQRGEAPKLLLRSPSPLFAGFPCEAVQGDITDRESLLAAFAGAETVYHLAGLIEIGDGHLDQVLHINVDGTQNVIAACKACGVKRLVYCSSVDAIPPAPEGVVMREATQFSSHAVTGGYAKSKAIATQAVLNSASADFSVAVGFPSACIGPYDYKVSSAGVMIRMFLHHNIPVSMNFGGYNFVDIRDVAYGLAACGDAERVPSGSCYLLAGEYITTGALIATLAELAGRTPPTLMLPRMLADLSAPLVEQYYKIFSKTPLFTSYSLRKLMDNGLFDHEKATRELGYRPRSIRESLQDMLVWLQTQEEAQGKE